MKKVKAAWIGKKGSCKKKPALSLSNIEVFLFLEEKRIKKQSTHRMIQANQKNTN